MAVMEKDDEDAICRRTRARYSLAGFTLDELETFLQETDDEDDVQNVDDEEEYKKFLAAVLQGVEGNSANAQDHENVDDEDEDNDADFELEIEEALESDLDENLKDDIGEGKAIEQRPKTRLSRRQKYSVEHKKASGESTRQLRPLLPYSPIAMYSAFTGKGWVPRAAPICISSPNGLINGFTPYQIGQLHSLIHEHVQLLIQTFSLCVLDPVKQYIAPDVHKLISELLCKRDQMLAQGRAPYPQVCFIPKHIHSSMDGSAPDILPRRNINGLSSASDMQGDCSAALNGVQPSNCTSPSTGRLVYASTEQDECLRSAEGSSWMPYVGDKTVTVLDVAPLKLVRKFLDDVSVAQECQRRQLGATCDVSAEKVPLFPACDTQLSAEADHPALLPSPISKKTLAASLVERAKKQSIALVPKEIAKLAKQFYPLFNPVLYPHKPPPAAVVNRVLFTDAEDKLLALGVREYNTDWKAIQQQFLPCKSKHQIFVRQKNRSSSKAPENPIKAARRLKNSPLTSEEIARIEEGLRVFKLDWMSVWKFFVPYRDPSLLPRQWRIATGTQKSYRSNADKKERRRLYESQKRKCKAAALENLHPSSEKLDTGSADNFGEKYSADDCTDKDGEAYVHEAFLADSRAGLPIISSEAPLPDIVDESCPHPPKVDGSRVGEKINELGCSDHQPQINSSSRTEVLYMRPYRARKSSTTRMVKLSPGLPPVSLPPTARVMSCSALKTNQSVLAQTRFSSAAKVANSTKEVLNNTTESGSTNHKESEVLRDRCVAEEKACPDLQMHPLLFRAPEDCNLLHQGNSGPDANSSFTLFPGSPPQLNLSLYRHTNHALNVLNKALKPNGKASTSSGLCFHPLLQRTTDENSVAQPSASSDLPREMFTQPIPNYSERTEIEMHPTLMPRKEKALEKRVSRSPTPAKPKSISPYKPCSQCFKQGFEA
ncbi:unnamed protein product [Cuscuta campestris]|uniref:Myb-like domain-containing protein n=1 Tax=Cuscuta campestris TaxID=132261 RepID=A0A484MVF4_9ASTE|nr:unnamed protein product [Cuscuta campestris]